MNETTAERELRAELAEAKELLTLGLKGAEMFTEQFVPAFRKALVELGQAKMAERLDFNHLERDGFMARAKLFLLKTENPQ
jgi:hypothetical protein